jgi:hypothetical protein
MKCPICDSEMIAFRWQCEDASGWTFGWRCACTAEQRDAQEQYAEVIVSSRAAEELIGYADYGQAAVAG